MWSRMVLVLNVPYDSGFVDGLFQVGSLEYAGLTKDIDED